MDDERTPPLTPSIQHVLNVAEAERVLRERDGEDKRIDERADKRIESHAAACPAVLGYHRLIGAIAVVGFGLLAALGVGGVLIDRSIELEGKRTREVIRQDLSEMVRAEIDRRWYAATGRNSSWIGKQ